MVAAFRVDASVQIGTGHFMRCLTLADGLRHKGVQTLFVCRHLPDNFKNILHKKNHEIRRLAGGQRNETVDELSHAAWLGVSQLDDARDFLEAVSDLSIDWVIIDHYAIDKRWEIVVKSKETKILVLDDLADREHECDILLDQNVYSDMDDRYTNKVPTCCRLLLGPKYCLLRDEFRLNRKTVRVRTVSAKRILIFFGGVDPSNFTLNAIHALTSGPFLELDVDVVIGSMHPFRTEIEQTCLNNGFQCHVQIDDISKLMAKADICIGSGGTATLERCCLGLPTIAIPIANNQVKQIYDAALFGLLYAPEFVGDFISGLKRHLIAFLENPSLRNGISKRDLDLVDGNGIFHLISEMKCSGIQMRNAESADENNLFKVNTKTA